MSKRIKNIETRNYNQKLKHIIKTRKKNTKEKISIRYS